MRIHRLNDGQLEMVSAGSGMTGPGMAFTTEQGVQFVGRASLIERIAEARGYDTFLVPSYNDVAPISVSRVTQA